MAIEIAALSSEITSDPAGLGYAVLLTADNLAGVLALLNGGAYSINRGEISRSDLARDIVETLVLADALPDSTATPTNPQTQQPLALPTGQEMSVKVFKAFLQALPLMDTINLASARVQGVLFACVLYGVMSQATFADVTTVAGTRAEYLFGRGAVVTVEDLWKALERN